MQLDHLVINTRFATDLAVRQFERLGFQLTPRGHHSLGSINNLIMFEGHYLELIGLPVGATTLRQEVVESVDGIDGLVLRTLDAAATSERLQSCGFAMQPVQHFSRPVTVEQRTLDARFETVRLVPGQYAAGRVYYCKHFTPELVWRDEWLSHPNGASCILSMTVLTPDVAHARRQYDLLDEPAAETSEAFDLVFQSRPELVGRFGSLAAYAPQRENGFAAITFGFPDQAALQRVAAAAQAAGLPTRTLDTVQIALPDFFTLIECQLSAQ